MSEEGARKSAILLMALGEDGAAGVLSKLDAMEIELLGVAMAKLGQDKVSREELSGVLHEFRVETEQLSALHLDPGNYIRAVLQKALGSEQASNLIEEIMRSEMPRGGGIQRLNRLEASEIVELVRDEHPQILATVLVHLERAKAAEVLEGLPQRLRTEVILRVATFGGVQPTALQELTDVLGEVLSGDGLKRSRLGGVRTAAEIVNLMSTAREEEVLAHVRETDEALAQRIVDEMFVFENLLDVDDRSLQRLLKDVDNESLIIALKGASPQLREKFFANMSTRAAETLREDLEVRGPVRVSQVETEQKAILQIVRGLAEAGEMVIASAGAEDYV